MKWANICIEKGYVNSKERDAEGKSDRVVNIGDYAQLLAIDNLYSYMGVDEEDIIRIEYYDLLDYDGEYVILPINFIFFNPYYGERELLLSPRIIPVFLGIHCINANFSINEFNYFSKYSPIGCRDERTMELFRKAGIHAYLQGCISATLPQRPQGVYERIYVVDIPETLNRYLPQNISDNTIYLSQQFYGNMEEHLIKESCETIREYMKKRLKLYRDTAKLVITSRLHCAVPCIAMGIPVIFVCDTYLSSYAWLEKLIPVYTRNEFAKIDWNPCAIEYEEMKEVILNNASRRLKDTKEKYEEIIKISEFYENRVKRDYKNSYIMRIDEFVSKEWKGKKEIKYGIWGITQSSDEVYNWISQNYPNAVLSVVIDEFRDIEFKGIKAVKSEEIQKYRDCYFFATGNSSSIAAQKKFKELGLENRFCSVYGKLYKDV